MPAGDNPDNGQGPLSAAHPSDGPTSPAQARPRRRAQRPAKRTASHASKIRRDQEAPEPHAGPESAQLSGNPGRAGQAARRSSRGGSQPAAAASGRHSSRLTRPFKFADSETRVSRGQTHAQLQQPEGVRPQHCHHPLLAALAFAAAFSAAILFFSSSSFCRFACRTQSPTPVSSKHWHCSTLAPAPSLHPTSYAPL